MDAFGVFWCLIGLSVATCCVASAIADRKRERRQRDHAQFILRTAPRYRNEDGEEVVDLTGYTADELLGR